MMADHPTSYETIEHILIFPKYLLVNEKPDQHKHASLNKPIFVQRSVLQKHNRQKIPTNQLNLFPRLQNNSTHRDARGGKRK